MGALDETNSCLRGLRKVVCVCSFGVIVFFVYFFLCGYDAGEVGLGSSPRNIPYELVGTSQAHIQNNQILIVNNYNIKISLFPH